MLRQRPLTPRQDLFPTELFFSDLSRLATLVTLELYPDAVICSSALKDGEASQRFWHGECSPLSACVRARINLRWDFVPPCPRHGGGRWLQRERVPRQLSPRS